MLTYPARSSDASTESSRQQISKTAHAISTAFISKPPYTTAHQVHTTRNNGLIYGLFRSVHHRGDTRARLAIVSCCHCGSCLCAPASPCATFVAKNWGWPRSGRKKKFVCRAKYRDNRTVLSIASGHLEDGYKPPTALHHQLQESPTEVDRLLQHHISAISAVKLDLFLDDG